MLITFLIGFVASFISNCLFYLAIKGFEESEKVKEA